MYVSDPNIPIPALASRYFMERTGLKVGGEVELVFGKLLMPVTIQGVVDFFPTMYNNDAGFIIVNQEHLFYYAGMTSERATAIDANGGLADADEGPRRAPAGAGSLPRPLRHHRRPDHRQPGRSSKRSAPTRSSAPAAAASCCSP